MSTEHDPRRILDGLSAQAEALRVLQMLRLQVKPWHTIRQVQEMLKTEFALRAQRVGMDPDLISDFEERAQEAFLAKREELA